MVYDRRGKRCSDCNNHNSIHPLSMDVPSLDIQAIIDLAHGIKSRRDPNTVAMFVNPSSLPVLDELFVATNLKP